MKYILLDSLDSLLNTNDELAHHFAELETYIKAMEKKLQETNPGFVLMLNKNNTMLQFEEGLASLVWDESKFASKHKTINEVLDKMFIKLHSSKKSLADTQESYYKLNDDLKQLQKSDNEALSLMKADYREIIKNNLTHMVKTDYLTTMLCFVQKKNAEFFVKNYLKICENWVLPQSIQYDNKNKLIFRKLDRDEDEQMSLYRVVIMDHVKDDFCNNARKNFKCFAKEYDEKEISSLPLHMKQMELLKLQINEKMV